MFGINCLHIYFIKGSQQDEQGQRSCQRSNEDESNNG
jgi:hypothetical protein